MIVRAGEFECCECFNKFALARKQLCAVGCSDCFFELSFIRETTISVQYQLDEKRRFGWVYGNSSF